MYRVIAGDLATCHIFAVHLEKVLEVMSASVYVGVNPFNFIRKHFRQISVRKVAVH
jgi:hypothetical protein